MKTWILIFSGVFFFFFFHSVQFAQLDLQLKPIIGNWQDGLKFSGFTAACRNNIQLSCSSFCCVMVGFF